MLESLSTSALEAIVQAIATTIVGGGALLIYRHFSRRPARRQYLKDLRNDLYEAVRQIDLTNDAPDRDTRCDALKGLAGFFRTIGQKTIFSENLFGKRHSLYLSRLGILCNARAEVIESNLDMLAERGIEDEYVFVNKIEKARKGIDLQRSELPYALYLLQPLFLIERILKSYRMHLGYDFFKFVEANQVEALEKLWLNDIPNLAVAPAGAEPRATDQDRIQG